MTKVAIDLFCGLGGWTDGLLATGFDVVGFDNERHEYGEHRYPAQLVLQDVRTLHGSQLKDAALIVASPPCTEYSYMAMPWRRAKRIARALRGDGDSTSLVMENGRVLDFDDDGFPIGYSGSRTVAQLNELFDACFRIQREACEAAGRHVPMVVENVKGAQPWVGRARWHYGSFYLWGDVPTLMSLNRAIKNNGGSWFNVAHNTTSGKGRNHDGRLTTGPLVEGRKGVDGKSWIRDKSKDPRPSHGNSPRRKAASALIAKIPFDLAYHVGQVYRP